MRPGTIAFSAGSRVRGRLAWLRGLTGLCLGEPGLFQLVRPRPRPARFHRIQRFALGRRARGLGSGVPLRTSSEAGARCRARYGRSARPVSLTASRMCFLRLGRLRAVGQTADHRADLVDDLGVVERQRGVRLGVLKGQLERRFQRGADLCRRCPSSAPWRSTGPGCTGPGRRHGGSGCWPSSGSAFDRGFRQGGSLFVARGVRPRRRRGRSRGCPAP